MKRLLVLAALSGGSLFAQQPARQPDKAERAEKLEAERAAKIKAIRAKLQDAEETVGKLQQELIAASRPARFRKVDDLLADDKFVIGQEGPIHNATGQLTNREGFADAAKAVKKYNPKASIVTIDRLVLGGRQQAHVVVVFPKAVGNARFQDFNYRVIGELELPGVKGEMAVLELIPN